MAGGPTLPGLPTELRAKIYDYVLHMDVDCIVLKNIEHVTGSNGTQAVLIPNIRANVRSLIPWLNLQLTCKAIAVEMRSYMKGASFLNVELNRTYALDLEVYHNSVSSKHDRLVKWRSIPCPPTHAKFLVVNVLPRRGPAPWTEGGPASLARAIYQILNH